MSQRQRQTDVEAGIAGRLHGVGNPAQARVQRRLIRKTNHFLCGSRAQQIESQDRAIKIGNRGVDCTQAQAKDLRRIKTDCHPVACEGQITRHGLSNRPALGVGEPNLSDWHIHAKRSVCGLHEWEAVKPTLQTHLDIASLSALQRRGQPSPQFWT